MNFSLANIQGDAPVNQTQQYEIELSVSGTPSGDWKIVFDGGANEYTVQHNTGSLLLDLNNFIDAEAANILVNNGFEISYVITATGATITLDSTGADAVVTTENVSSNVVTSVNLIRSSSTGAGQPQITEIVFLQVGPAPLESMSGITFDATATSYGGPDFATYGTIDAALNAWVTLNAAAVLSNEGFVVTKPSSDRLRFEGADNVTSTTFTVNDTSSDVDFVVDYQQTAVAGGTVQRQLSYIQMDSPSATGSFDITIDNGSISRTYTLDLLNNNIEFSLARFRSFYRTNIYSIFGVSIYYVGSQTNATTGRLYWSASSPSISFTLAISNDSSNVSPTAVESQASSTVPGVIEVGYSSGVMLYGIKKLDGDFAVVRDQKDRIVEFLVEDWFDIFSNEFNTSIYVTALNESLYALNGKKVVSLEAAGTGSQISYDLDGFGLKVFEVQEDPATIEAAIDAL